MPLTASAYKELYLNLNVPLLDGQNNLSGWKKVKVDRYLLADVKPNLGKNQDELMGPIRQHFKKPKSSLKVFVGLAEVEERTFYSWPDVWYYAKKGIWGKGSPEELQITLQLALRFNLTTTAQLQSYCDQKVGLDCNGFVGNYLEHGVRGKSWDANKVGHAHYDANTGVRDIMSKLGPEVRDMADIQMLQNYVMGLVDPHTKEVINQGKFPNIAHIVVTTPFTFFGMHKGKAQLSMRVVESTGGIGLTESTYFVLSGQNKVFQVWRGSKNERREFRMRPVK